MSEPTATVELTEGELDALADKVFHWILNADADHPEYADADSAFQKVETLRVKLAEERMRRAISER